MNQQETEASDSVSFSPPDKAIIIDQPFVALVTPDPLPEIPGK